MPPVARMTAGASNRTNWPVSRTYPNAPAIRPPSLISRVIVVSAKTLIIASGSPNSMASCLLQGDDLLLQGPDHLQPGPVADVRQPRVLVAAEVPLADLAVLGPVEDRAPRLELPDPVRRLLGVQLGHPPVVEELAAAHGVAEVHLPVVVRVDVAHGGGAPPSAMTVCALPNSDLEMIAVFLPAQPGLDRGAQAGPARADHDHVVGVTARSRSRCRCRVIRLLARSVS